MKAAFAIRLVLRDLSDGRKVFIHDVHDSVTIHDLSETFKMAVKLLLLLAVERVVDITHKNQGTRIERRRATFT